jgi:hypothetical protein
LSRTARQNRAKIGLRHGVSRPRRRQSGVAARRLLRYNPVMTRMLTVILGLLTLSGCITQRTNHADQGLCESETTRNGKIRIICH